MKDQLSVIKRPIISEKSTALAEVAGRVVFEVDLAANKYEIKDAVQKLFDVRVRKVRTIVNAGKVKRIGQTWIKTNKTKKAIVSLEEGQTIDFFGAPGS